MKIVFFLNEYNVIKHRYIYIMLKVCVLKNHVKLGLEWGGDRAKSHDI